jgi:hypothetical protein
MKREVGLWIDHHRTVMVIVENEKEVTREIRSNVGTHLKPASVIAAKKTQKSSILTPGESTDRRIENHLGYYYAGVISLLRSADFIWIFGPGEAKVELKRLLDQQELGGRIIKVEAAGKMTDRQIAVKARLLFSAFGKIHAYP